ncbi:MAG: Cys-tRNA(Pro) deacylase [Desulfobacterales bacterium]|nr:MAG: Cys-tRNA(Pro) deacylase [Desulfobacterales bacterium]
MTPAVAVAKEAKIKYTLHEYDHDPAVRAFGLEASEKLGIDPTRIYKTLVIDLGDLNLAVAVVPVAVQLDLKAVAKAFGVKKVFMADKKRVEKTTGYIVGGVSPLGQKKRLATLIDISAQDLEMIWVSAGRRGLQICLAPADLADLTQGQFFSIARKD